MLSAKLRSVGSRFCNSAGANTAGTPQVSLWARAVEEKTQRTKNAFMLFHFDEWLCWCLSAILVICVSGL